jgi:polyhydroxybutyrate depolymerase
MLSAQAALELWVRVDGCAAAVTEPVADTSDDGTLAWRTLFASCAAGSEVALYTLERGGHTWPGSPLTFPAELGPVSHDVSASRLLLEFFSRHSLTPRD